MLGKIGLFFSLAKVPNFEQQMTCLQSREISTSTRLITSQNKAWQEISLFMMVFIPRGETAPEHYPFHGILSLSSVYLLCTNDLHMEP